MARETLLVLPQPHISGAQLEISILEYPDRIQRMRQILAELAETHRTSPLETLLQETHQKLTTIPAPYRTHKSPIPATVLLALIVSKAIVESLSRDGRPDISTQETRELIDKILNWLTVPEEYINLLVQKIHKTSTGEAHTNSAFQLPKEQAPYLEWRTWLALARALNPILQLQGFELIYDAKTEHYKDLSIPSAPECAIYVEEVTLQLQHSPNRPLLSNE